MRTLSRSAIGPVFAAAVSAALLLGVCQPVFAAPTNAKIRARQRQAAGVQKKLDQLGVVLEMRGEELGQVESQLVTTRQQQFATEAKLEQATEDLNASQGLLDRRASSIYRAGKTDFLSVFLGATSFQDFLTRVELMRRIGNSDASVVTQVKAAREKVDDARVALQNRQDELTTLRDQARQKQAAVQQALSAQQSYLRSIKRDVKRLIAAERVREEKAAKARAKRLGFTFDPGSLKGARADVARISLRYLGVKYVWGGTTPAGFDCSGLCQYCYGQAGVQIPRTSREQFRVGQYIPPDRKDLLGAGDLVFFGYNKDPRQVHHVGIYLGGGDFINAPQTGDVVRIAALSSRDDYVGARRP